MSARLVIADDSPTILALVTIAVKKDGYEPVTATKPSCSSVFSAE